jgi:hypothetical protein
MGGARMKHGRSEQGEQNLVGKPEVKRIFATHGCRMKTRHCEFCPRHRVFVYRGGELRDAKKLVINFHAQNIAFAERSKQATYPGDDKTK